MVDREKKRYGSENNLWTPEEPVPSVGRTDRRRQSVRHAGKRAPVSRSRGERTAKARTPQRSVTSELMLLLMKIGMIVIFFIIMFTFFFGIMKQPDRTMEPAVKEGDLIIYYLLQKEDFESRDTVIVENPEGKKQCRRIVAMSGDSLDITEAGLQINGYRQQEEGIYTETLPYTGSVRYPVNLEEDHYFVLADNRDNSEDSRVYGQVDSSAVKGKVMAIIRRRGI